MRSERFALLRACALGVSLASASVASGCVIVVDGHGHHSWDDDYNGRSIKKTCNLNVPHQAGKPIDVQSRNGAVSVVSDPSATDVSIEAVVYSKDQSRLEAINVKAERDGEGTLRVGVEWPGGKPKSNEGCSFKIRVPDARGVNINTSNGAVTLEGLDGDAVADTSNGSIRVERQGGSLRADTSNGKITVVGVAGNVVADTSNGSVSIEDVAGSVTADSSNGRVSITLAPSSPGPVTIDTSNGSVEVICGPAFAGDVTMDTSNGSITLTEADGTAHKGKGRLNATIGAGGAKSVVSTSNGSIQFRIREGG